VSIFAGVTEIIDEQLGVVGIGQAPHHKRMTAMLQLGSQGRPGFDGRLLFEDILARLEDNLEIAPRFATKGPSPQNWRFAKQPKISANNRSPEKNLEKAAARLLGPSWVNQVPSSSGLWDANADRARNVDLVEQMGDQAYRFIELKIESDNALYAAMEILGYGALYVLSRRRYPQAAIASKRLLQAKRVELCVLAPPSYYQRVNLSWLERALCHGLREYSQRHPTLGLDLDFRYQAFPKEIRWPLADREVVDLFERRTGAFPAGR
jgi:hypothetical protein